MRLLLVRHGESVDNVAGLYAGSRDSPLTSHGVLQAQLLGAHLANQAQAIGRISHIFSSDLQRAFKTAEAIAQAQKDSRLNTELVPSIEKAVELRERDFRSGEGQKFGTRAKDVDAETQEEMRARITRFIQAYLQDIIEDDVAVDAPSQSVVIVAHGRILNVLLKVLLARYPSPLELWRSKSGYGAPWSNTGYLEAHLTRGGTSPAVGALTQKYQMAIVRMNCVEHLQGIRKTRGGIGSAKFDDKQKTMDSFFSRVAKTRKSNEQADGT